MLIRSQNKKTIINLSMTRGIYASKTSAGYALIAESGFNLATYSTEEKAINMLDMICNCYKNSNTTDGIILELPSDSEVH